MFFLRPGHGQLQLLLSRINTNIDLPRGVDVVNATLSTKSGMLFFLTFANFFHLLNIGSAIIFMGYMGFTRSNFTGYSKMQFRCNSEHT